MKYHQHHPEERVIANRRVIHLFVFGFPPCFAQNPFSHPFWHSGVPMMFVMVKSGANALLILSPCSYTPP